MNDRESVGINTLGKEEIVPFFQNIKRTPTIEDYRKFFSPLLWNQVNHYLDYLREYEIWLEGISNLMVLTEKYKGQLSEKEYAWNTYLLVYVYLKILDKLDLWEEFIKNFEDLRETRAFKFPHNPKFDVTDSFVHRYEIIKRKLDRKRQGKSYLHLLHRQKDSLTAEEVERRKSVFTFWFNYALNFKNMMSEMMKRRHPSAEKDLKD